MKRAPRSLQHHVLYRKYNGQDSEISALLGKCGLSIVVAPSALSYANEHFVWKRSGVTYAIVTESHRLR